MRYVISFLLLALSFISFHRLRCGADLRIRGVFRSER